MDFLRKLENESGQILLSLIVRAHELQTKLRYPTFSLSQVLMRDW